MPQGFATFNPKKPLGDAFTGCWDNKFATVSDLKNSLLLGENHGIFCSIVVYPVIPKGMILLRLIPTATHTLEDVHYTIECFSKVKKKLEAGEYANEMKEMTAK